ncbi:hypothetical protein [Facklamia hominis]|uniref:hypothetical protein n=1 Tax=Facklamia hominis TaxID=178214 RepID=UPI0038FC7DC1
MIIEILAIISIPAIASTAFLLGQKSVESRENVAYRAGVNDGYQDGYEQGRKEEKIVRMAR